MKKQFECVVLVCLILSPALHSQISIDWNEIPRHVGDSAYYKIADESVGIDVGNPGGPQEWTFDSSFAGFIELRHITDVNGSPFATYFPTANLLHIDEAPDDTEYAYNRLNEDELLGLGIGSFVQDSPIVMHFDPPAQLLVFPLEFGTTWNMYSMTADSIDSLSYAVLEYFRDNVVDAYGTLNIPFGSFPALRVNSLMTLVLTVYVNGIPIDSDTSNFRGYSWFIEQYGSAVVAQSEEGDTSSNFTQADCFTVLVDASLAAIAEKGNAKADCLSLRIVPSPFRSATTISFTVQKENWFTVNVYDVTGGKIAELYDGPLSTGRHTFLWNATNAPGSPAHSGMYFCLVRSSSGTQKAKMLLMP